MHNCARGDGCISKKWSLCSKPASSRAYCRNADREDAVGERTAKNLACTLAHGPPKQNLPHCRAGGKG